MKALFNNDLIDKMFPAVAAQHGKMYDKGHWFLETPIETSQGYTKRLNVGDLVTIEGDKLVHCIDKPTHKIKGIKGTLYCDVRKAKLEVVNLIDGTIKTIDV